jgi:hypothetical protein
MLPIYPILLLPLLATPCLAVTGEQQVTLQLTPIHAGATTHLRIRSQVPAAPAFLMTSFQSAATASPGLGLPAFGLPLGSSLIPFQLDGIGALDMAFPMGSGLVPLGLQLRAQVFVLGLKGDWLPSPVVATTLAPAPPGVTLISAQSGVLPSKAVALFAESVLSCDVNLDGRPDLLVSGASGDELWMNVPVPGGFQLVPDANALAGLPALGLARVFGDINSDGLPDLISGPSSNGTGAAIPGRVCIGDGVGSFTPGPSLLSGAGDCSDLALADLDGDGDLDLVVAMGADPHTGIGGSADHILWNDGAGNFTDDLAFAAASFNDPVASTTSIAIGDVNHDGLPDLWFGKTDLLGQVGSVGQQNLLVYVFGVGNFFDITSLNLPALEDNTSDVELVDVDLDGDLDLVAANVRTSLGADQSGDLLINQGGVQGGILGTFLDVQDPALETVLGQAIRLGLEVADVDNDGDMDVLFTVHDLPPSSDQALYINQGGAQAGTPGSFAFAPWFKPGGLVASSACFADFDVDGDIDLALPSTGTLTGDPKAGDLQLFLGATSL